MTTTATAKRGQSHTSLRTCARYGVAVRIVDKAKQRTDKSKDLVVWSRTLELLTAPEDQPLLSKRGSRSMP